MRFGFSIASVITTVSQNILFNKIKRSVTMNTQFY